MASGFIRVVSLAVAASFAAVFAGCGGRTPVAPTRLTEDAGDETSPAFSPDGRFVAYAWETSAGESDIWVIDLETKEKRRVTYAPEARSGNPAWSPDGKWIAFDSTRDGGRNIYVVDAETGEGNAPGQRARGLTSGAASSGAPSWSPDGKAITFESDRNGRFDIWVMQADGSTPRVLTRSASHDHTPAWSPDGRLIAFSSERTGDPDIWVMNPDGSHPRRVTADTCRDRRPRWTPDGGQLVYVRSRDPGRREFWQVFRNGKDPRQLAASSDDIAQPVVSPDGARLAFSSNHQGTYDIYLLRLDTERDTR